MLDPIKIICQTSGGFECASQQSFLYYKQTDQMS